MKHENEESLLNSLPLNDYAKSYNWLIPTMIIGIMLLGIYLSIKDLYFFNISNFHIVEKLMNKT